MNYKRLSISIISVFAFVFILEFFVHGYLLEDLYSQTSDLWREKDDFLMHYMTLSQFGFALFVTLLCAFLCCSSTKKCCYTLSALFGLVLASLQVSTYAYMPIPLELTLWWCLTTFVKGTGAFLLATCIYKK